MPCAVSADTGSDVDVVTDIELHAACLRPRPPRRPQPPRLRPRVPGRPGRGPQPRKHCNTSSCMSLLLPLNAKGTSCGMYYSCWPSISVHTRACTWPGLNLIQIIRGGYLDGDLKTRLFWKHYVYSITIQSLLCVVACLGHARHDASRHRGHDAQQLPGLGNVNCWSMAVATTWSTLGHANHPGSTS